MAGSLNRVDLIGRLGKDPESRNSQAGGLIVNLSVATSETWKDRNSGERKEATEWHRVVIFNEALAGVAEKHLRKGDLVHVTGTLKTRKWTDQQGVDRYSTEVVLGNFGGTLNMLGSPSAGEGGSQRGSGGTSGGSTGGGSDSRPKGGADLDDDIPF